MTVCTSWGFTPNILCLIAYKFLRDLHVYSGVCSRKQNKPYPTLPSTKSGLDNYLFFPSTNKWQFHIVFEELEGEEEHEFH